jgi:hypothetical protein
MQIRRKLLSTTFLTVMVLNSMCFSVKVFAQTNISSKTKTPPKGTMLVGTAVIDITPEGPILLAGYGGRKSESEGVLQPLRAKALAFGSDSEGPSILITVDLIGIQYYMTKEVARRLSDKIGVDPSRFVISASHTHTGPEIGNLLNHFARQLPPEEIGRINKFLEILTEKLEKVSIEALNARKPAKVAWGQGKVGFAMNRRRVVNGKSVGMTPIPEGPVDHDLPLLRITDLDGKLRAVMVSYACHGTTLGPDINKIHGDWIGEAQKFIEEKNPGAIAMVSLGCGADANPEPRVTSLQLDYAAQHGKEVANEVQALLSSDLKPLTSAPQGRSKVIQLPFEHIPTVQEFVEQANEKGAKAYFAKLALDKIARGETIPKSLTYPVTTWTFGNDLAMVFLAGEVVVDYSLRLKKELALGRLWVNAYSNDVPCYIASKRVIREGGYEVESSMYSYNQPGRFQEGIEDLIVATVHDLLPSSYKPSTKK